MREGDLRRWHEAALGGAPRLNDGSSLGKRGEDLFLQALVTQAAVEALDEAALLGLSGRDVAPFDPLVIGPFEHGATDHLGPVVADERRWLAAGRDEGVEFPDRPAHRSKCRRRAPAPRR